MKSRFETTKEEDEKAKDAIDEALKEAYGEGKVIGARPGWSSASVRLPYSDNLWEKLLKILGIGEWDD